MNQHINTDRTRIRDAFVRTMLARFEPARSGWLERLLRRHGHDVRTVATDAEAYRSRREMDLALIEIDDGEGSFDLCRMIRSATRDISLIAVSSTDTEHERLQALEAGFDDHLYADCSPAEVMARIDAVLRWTRLPGSEPSMVVYGPLRIDTDSREVRLHGEIVHLTRKEYDLLLLLATRAGAVTDRTEVLVSIWGEDSRFASRTLDTHVSRLRRKLGRWVCITVKGYGLRIGSPPEVAEAE
ncbi:MAG TPA: response regulator transcription factor [Amycolatopsis sp.]|uniref:response regulator transcription factor n=1 Tax=Amycolatopsis sp. TaxID=37632 RepID=UPI002B49BEA5|nr:response regulator transcription factor [Amycolatopsis sp.]HKS47307.1 response regulator transcription factor [Amycolatopsis sp.]